MIKNWTNKSSCIDMDTNMFFDRYEEDVSIRDTIDLMCSQCPVQRECLAVGVTRQEWGVWGGVYLEKGKISKDFNAHKRHDQWFDLWASLTMEIE